MNDPTPTDRQRTINGLREVADYLQSHPDVPVATYQHICYPVDASGVPADGRRAEVDRVAAAMDTTARIGSGGHYTAKRTFGPVELAVFSCHPEPAKETTS